jgi:outer membrane protein OmpA-like peptidoglycan-associated protein
MARLHARVNVRIPPQLIVPLPSLPPWIAAAPRFTELGHHGWEKRMLQIDEHKPESNTQALSQVVQELRDRNEALRYLTRWRCARESYQIQALRRSMHAITDGLTVNIPFRTGSWSIEPHLEAHLSALARALIEIPCMQVKLEGFADTRGSRRFNRKLSMRRVYAVWTVLARSELPIERMRLKADGDRNAMYPKGDRGGYFFDRRVVISFTLGGVPR